MKKLPYKSVVALIVVGAICALFVAHPVVSAQKQVQRTRQNLRRQGFKTDLSDFDFSTSFELRSREAILKAAASPFRSGPARDDQNLMETVGAASVIVVWKQDSLKRASPSWPDNNDVLPWEEFRAMLHTSQTTEDAACEAALSGPIGFNLDAKAGNGILLPHLAMLNNLAQSFGSRAVLDLHDGDRDGAWTNLLAETRLATAWDPEPAEVSQLVRFAIAKLAYTTTWQLLQSDGWSDIQLTRLQAEWEGVDFFKHLPETAAFQRASIVAECEQERNPPMAQRILPADFLKTAFRHPSYAWLELNALWKRRYYLKHGSYEDETNLLVFFRDRELELRHAVQAATWSQMRQLPGVTNKVLFQSKYPSILQEKMNFHALMSASQSQGVGFLGRAAEAEARRRIIISALALVRYRKKHGSYPRGLGDLAPEFLKSIPVGFMDGQPLRYRLTDDGHFLLYSVGLDCVDHGGKIQTREQAIRTRREDLPVGMRPEADIVWPMPASRTVVAALREEQLAVRRKKAAEIEEFQARSQWDHTTRHQAGAEKMLALAPSNPPDVKYHGRPLSEILRNQNSVGTNLLTLGQMLTLHQIITGDEPETITFEAPVAYDVVTNIGNLSLFIDTNNDDFDGGCYVQQMDCNRAVNGNCLLLWSTLYESPGKHALQMGLLVNDMPPNGPDLSGPLLPFVITNLCQLSLTSAHFDPDTGATLHAKLPEANGSYTIELTAATGTRLKRITGSTTNGVIKAHWNLIDEQGRRFTNDFFNSVFHLTLPDSGRTQILRGP